MTDLNAILDPFERKLIRRALTAHRYRTQRDIGQNDEKGWKPAPGKLDINKANLAVIDDLMTKITEPHPAELDKARKRSMEQGAQ